MIQHVQGNEMILHASPLGKHDAPINGSPASFQAVAPVDLTKFQQPAGHASKSAWPSPRQPMHTKLAIEQPPAAPNPGPVLGLTAAHGLPSAAKPSGRLLPQLRDSAETVSLLTASSLWPEPMSWKPGPGPPALGSSSSSSRTSRMAPTESLGKWPSCTASFQLS